MKSIQKRNLVQGQLVFMEIGKIQRGDESVTRRFVSVWLRRTVCGEMEKSSDWAGFPSSFQGKWPVNLNLANTTPGSGCLSG